MIRCFFLLVATLYLNKTVTAQAANFIRYTDFIFPQTSVKKNQIYSSNVPSHTKEKFYRYDLYQPKNDTASNRPLIIWMHGGGFKFGSRKAKGIRLWSKSFARRGYVCAAINYRLSKKNPLRNFKALVNGCYDAMHDLAEAIDHFKLNASSYSIDPNKIILAGNSAGAIIALQYAYASGEKLLTLVDSSKFSPGSDAPHHKIAGVINFWGAIFDSSWLHHARIPIVSVHGRRDRIVPYTHNGSSLFGSSIIHQKARELGIPNDLKTYDRSGHELQKHFIPVLRSGATKRRWLEAGKFAADFVYRECINE